MDSKISQLSKHILLIVRTDVVPEMEEEYKRWYKEEHIPVLLRVPGVSMGEEGNEYRKWTEIYCHL
jgi:vacuolar-type H+-ATPase subunit F/Vma7